MMSTVHLFTRLLLIVRQKFGHYSLNLEIHTEVLFWDDLSQFGSKLTIFSRMPEFLSRGIALLIIYKFRTFKMILQFCLLLKEVVG